MTGTRLRCITEFGKSGDTFKEKCVNESPERPYEKIVIISEILPKYDITKTEPFLKRVERINEEKVLNIKHLYATIQAEKQQGKKRRSWRSRGTCDSRWTWSKRMSWTVR